VPEAIQPNLVGPALTRRVQPIAYAAVLGAAYYFAARLGTGFRFQNSQISVVWPGSALLLAGLLLAPRRYWWALLLAVTVAHLSAMAGGTPVWRSIWQILIFPMSAIVGAELLERHVGRTLHFGSSRQVFAFTVISFGISLLFAVSTPSFIRSIIGLEDFGPLDAIRRATLSVATGFLLVTPVVMLWAHDRHRVWNRKMPLRYFEAGIMMSCVLTVGALALGIGPGIAQNPPLVLLVFLPLLWAAVRFGPTGAATALLVLAAISIWATAMQVGPFVTITEKPVLTLQLFWIVLWAPVMLIASVIREREQMLSELQQQRNQLAHVTRVATVGALSGALAHELNQPLTSILANAQAGARMLSRQPVDLAELRTIFNDIAHQDKQAADVIRHFRSLLKNGDAHFEHVRLDSVVRDAIALGHSRIAIARVQVHTTIPTDVPAVRGDPVQLLQLVLNLIMNACDAMSGRPVPERQLSLQVVSNGHHQVEIVVADSGAGLPADNEQGVFEPFFTTKAEGIGLGLTICRAIATAHGGRLWAENNVRGGATFHLVLPEHHEN
jgi:signal transduction histidine kinase